MTGSQRPAQQLTARQAVVTGLGVVAPSRVGTDAFWKAVQQGTAVLGPVSREAAPTCRCGW